MVPVTSTKSTVDALNVHDNVELPELDTVPGDMVQVDELFVVRVMVPVKPLTAETVTLALPVAFTSKETPVGLAPTEKSDDAVTW